MFCHVFLVTLCIRNTQLAPGIFQIALNLTGEFDGLSKNPGILLLDQIYYDPCFGFRSIMPGLFVFLFFFCEEKRFKDPADGPLTE